MKTTKISEDALAILSACVVDQLPGVGSIVRITDGQLERKLYQQVNAVLEEIGGKWKRGKGHLYPDNADVTSERLNGVILSGEIAPLRKNGFFPTPLPVAGPLFDLLQLHPGQMLLEPSCGDGTLIGHLLDLYPNTVTQDQIFAFEVNADLADKAKARFPNCGILNADFLGTSRLAGIMGDHGRFDRIFMNPPFENRADAKHVLHAYGLLKPGGRLVSVMAASVMFRRESEYQEVRDLSEVFEALPAGSFKTSGTMVNTVLVSIEKGAR